MPEKKLTPEQVDQLNANAAQMQEQGYSVDEIKSMASQYFNEFASEEGEPVNFTPASSEQSEGQSEEQKKDGTPSKQQPSQPSEPVGEVVEEVKQPVDKFDIASFQLPDMPTDPVSQAKLKAQEQQGEIGQDIQEQIDIWEQAPEIAKRAVDDKNRDSYIKEAQAVINSDKERLQEIEAEFKILTGEDTTGKVEIPPGFTVQDYVKELSEEYTTLNRDVVTTSGALYDAKSDKGGFIGAFQNLLMEGYTSTVDGGVKFLLNTMAQTNPEAFGTEDVEEALVRAREAAKDMAVKETLDLQLKDEDTTKEYIQSVKDKGIITQGVLGAVESIPAMTLPAGMFTMSYNAAIDEVQDVEGLTESEKATYATGIATIEAGLEYFGLSQLVKGAPGVTSQISKKLFNKVLKKVPKESTEDVLQRAVSSEIRTFSDKLKAAANPEKFINAFLVEAETGGTQEAAKLAAQKVINLYKDAELFELPEDIAGNIIESSIAEGIGGLTFGVGLGAGFSLLGGEKNFVANLSQKEFNELSNKLQDPQALQAIKDNIQAQVNLDPNKASQAQKTLEAVEELSGALKSVPADINNRKAVTNLMLDKIRLDKQAENAPDKTIYNKKINSLESEIDELIDAPEIVEETTEQPTTETTTEETVEETPLVTDESGEVVTVYRGGKPASGVQYYTSDQKLAEGIGEGKGEGVQKATVRMANPWTPESLDVNNAPQWMQDWVRSQEEFTTVDEETMAAEEIPMEQAIQEIKDMQLSFRDVGLWQSFVNEALEHHDGIIAFDPSEDMATDKKIYITKSPEQVVTEETTEEAAPVEEVVEEDVTLDDISKKYEDVTIDVFEKENVLSLDRIIVPEGKRGEGIGSNVMQDLIDYADKNNLKIILTPSKDFGATSVTRLKKFYKQFGFIDNKGKNRDFSHKESMYRNPEEVVSKTEEAPIVTEDITKGKKEITEVKSGTHTSSNPIKIFKGLGGKVDLKGVRINAHEGVKGVFTAVDEDLAKEYAKDKGMSETTLPAGTTFEVVEVDGTGMTPGQYRAAEVKAINDSKADVVKLITVDGKIKAGTKKQEQYVIKNEKLIEDAIQEQEVTTEETAPSKKRLDEQIDGIIKKVKDRTSDKADPKKVNKRAFDDAVEYLQTSLWYEKANDLQREASVIELMEKTKQPVKKSMTIKGAIKKAFPPTPEKRVSMTPLAALKKQIQDFARGMREAAKEQRATVKNANDLLKELQKSGVITPRQAGALTRAALKVNFASPKSIENFTNRVEKTIRDIEYNTKLSDATSLRGKIKPKKNTLASDKARVNEFRKIDPKNVEDIDAYIEKANEIVASIKSPRRTAKGVSLPTAMDYAAIDEYNKTTLEEQDKKAKQSIKDQYDYLEDFDLTVEEMNEIISLLEQGKEPQLTDARKEQINERLNTLFTFYKPALEEKLTEEGLTDTEKNILKTLKDSNIDNLPFNEKARTIKVAENILQNNDFSAAQQVVNAIDAQQSVAEIQKANIKFDIGGKLKTYFQKGANLTQAMKFIFRGAKAADNFAVKAGITDFDIGVVNATNRVDKVIDKYNDMVKNMNDHNTAVNIVKRRVYSFLTRNDGTTATEKKAEFDRRKGLINEQLEYLKLTDGEFAKELETVLSDLGIAEAQTADDIQIDEQNKKIVDFFVQEFEDLYDEHSEVAKVLYNKILPQDSKYLPDVFEKVDKSDMFVKLDESVYFEDAIDTKETSMLQDVSKPSSLPKVNGEVTRAINLDFDRIMMRKLEDAIKEIETAQSVDKLKKVLTTENLNKFLSPTQADLLKSKITNYVNAIRGKSINQKEIADSKTVNKVIDRISNFTATKILGSAAQPIKQTIPVYVRSTINMSSKGSSAMNNALIGKAPELVEIANKYGEVSLRGKQSVVDVDALSSKVDFDKLSDSVIKLVGISGAKNIRDAKKALSKAGEAPLKYALEKPDKWMATASWAGYYADYLYKNKPDFNLKEELENPTKEAIQYANSRVSETQNESQREKMGDFFTSKSTTAKVLRNVILPFASFQQNLRTDVYTNIGIAKSKTASKEDKKIAQKSIASAITEMAIFNVLSVSLRALTTVGIGTLLGMDGDEDEERELDPILGIPLTEKDKKIFYTNLISDAAPLPIVDDLALYGVEALNKYMTDKQYDKYKDNIVYAPGSAEEIILNKGGKFGAGYGIITDTKTKLDMSDFLNEDGTFTKSSIYGDKEYPIPEYLENDINLMIGLQALYLMGAPREFKTASDVIRKEIEAEAKIKIKPAF